jgi:hypothetical protein
MSCILIQVEFVGNLRTYAYDEFLSEKRFWVLLHDIWGFYDSEDSFCDLC